MQTRVFVLVQEVATTLEKRKKIKKKKIIWTQVLIFVKNKEQKKERIIIR